jgi:hypothetical protein
MRQVSLILLLCFVEPTVRLERVFVKRTAVRGDSIWRPIGSDTTLWYIDNDTGERPWPVVRRERSGHDGTGTCRAGILWGSRDGINGSVEFMPAGYKLEKGNYVYTVIPTPAGTDWSATTVIKGTGDQTDELDETTVAPAP